MSALLRELLDQQAIKANIEYRGSKRSVRYAHEWLPIARAIVRRMQSVKTHRPMLLL